MTVEEIIRQLQQDPIGESFDPFETALRAAAEQREAVVPELIAAINRVCDDPHASLTDANNFLYDFAIHLLAEFKEVRARDAFLRFLSLPGELAFDLTGDMITDYGAAVLASVCGGDPEPLLRLVHNESINMFVRSQAVDALLVQYAWGERSREAVVEDFHRLFRESADLNDAFVVASLVCIATDFDAREFEADIRHAFDSRQVADDVISLKNFESDLAKQAADPSSDHLKDFKERNALIDAVEYTRDLSSVGDIGPFLEADEDDDPFMEPEEIKEFCDSLGIPPSDDFVPAPYIAPPKIGRNVPCPCGSGKKFKKCCGKTAP